VAFSLPVFHDDPTAEGGDDAAGFRGPMGSS
jgi:hypothetical protein